MEPEFKRTSIIILGPPKVGISTIVGKLKKLLKEEEYNIEDLAGMYHYSAIPNSVLRSEIIIIVFDMSQKDKQEEFIMSLYYKAQEFKNKIILLGNKRDISKFTKPKLELLKNLISHNFYGEISSIGEDSEFSDLVEWIKNNRSEREPKEQRIKLVQIREKTFQHYLCGGDCGIPGDTYRFKYIKK
jgi:hypothetical protein